MRSRSDYVRADCVDDLRKQIAAYKRFKKLAEEWIDLGIEASKLRMMQIRRRGQCRGEVGALKYQIQT